MVVPAASATAYHHRVKKDRLLTRMWLTKKLKLHWPTRPLCDNTWQCRTERDFESKLRVIPRAKRNNLGRRTLGDW